MTRPLPKGEKRGMGLVSEEVQAIWRLFDSLPGLKDRDSSERQPPFPPQVV
jgi:hypothetical protein